jgi:hypothetical protein
MRAFVFDSRIGSNALIDSLLLHNSRFLDVVRVDSFNSLYTDELHTIFRNFSSNSVEFEKLCLERYFYAYQASLDLNINDNEEFFLIDSDIKLLNTDFLGDLPVGLCFSQCVYKDRLEPLLSPHFSKWNIKELRRFCKFIVDFYRVDDDVLIKHYNFVQEMTGGVSGLSDMYLLFLFVQDCSWTNTNVYSIGVIHNLYSNYIDHDITKILGINIITRLGLKRNRINVVHYQGSVGKLLAKYDKITLGLLLLLAVAKKFKDFIR